MDDKPRTEPRRQVNIAVTFRAKDGREFTLRFHPDTVASQKDHYLKRKGFVVVKEELDDPKARAEAVMASLSKPSKNTKPKPTL